MTYEINKQGDPHNPAKVLWGVVTKTSKEMVLISKSCVKSWRCKTGLGINNKDFPLAIVFYVGVSVMALDELA